jgi:hypothetical protein
VGTVVTGAVTGPVEVLEVVVLAFAAGAELDEPPEQAVSTLTADATTIRTKARRNRSTGASSPYAA